MHTIPFPFRPPGPTHGKPDAGPGSDINKGTNLLHASGLLAKDLLEGLQHYWEGKRSPFPVSNNLKAERQRKREGEGWRERDPG